MQIKCRIISKKEQAARDKKASEAASEYSKAAKESKVNPDRNAELLEIVKSKFPEADADTKAKVKEFMAENGIAKFTDPDIPTAVFEKIVQIIA